MSDPTTKLPNELKETPKKPAPKKTESDFIAMAMTMLQKEQAGKLKCRENRKALSRLQDAFDYLALRDKARKAK